MFTRALLLQQRHPCLLHVIAGAVLQKYGSKCHRHISVTSVRAHLAASFPFQLHIMYELLIALCTIWIPGGDGFNPGCFSWPQHTQITSLYCGSVIYNTSQFWSGSQQTKNQCSYFFYNLNLVCIFPCTSVWGLLLKMDIIWCDWKFWYALISEWICTLRLVSFTQALTVCFLLFLCTHKSLCILCFAA